MTECVGSPRGCALTPADCVAPDIDVAPVSYRFRFLGEVLEGNCTGFSVGCFPDVCTDTEPVYCTRSGGSSRMSREQQG